MQCSLHEKMRRGCIEIRIGLARVQYFREYDTLGGVGRGRAGLDARRSIYTLCTCSILVTRLDKRPGLSPLCCPQTRTTFPRPGSRALLRG